MYAQKTIQIGTIGIAQVAQPALAVVWSFLLLGEVVNAPPGGGHRDRHGRAAGLRAAAPARDRASVRSRSVMKCEAAAIRRSASSRTSASSPVARASASSAKHLGRRVAGRPGGSRIAASRSGPSRVERRQQALAEQRLLAAAGLAVEGRGRLERRPRLRVRPSARSTRPRCTRPSAASRTSPVASAFAIPELQRRRAGVVVAGLALRAAEARQLVGLGLQEAEPA